MKLENQTKQKFTKAIAKDIALSNFHYVLDGILGYADADYSFTDGAEAFEQNFEEDLQERGITPTTYRLGIISKEYLIIKDAFELHIRKKYYKKAPKK